MEKRNIIVFGASAGGFTVLKQLVAGPPIPHRPAHPKQSEHISPQLTNRFRQVS